jgi:hypothetical protein
MKKQTPESVEDRNALAAVDIPNASLKLRAFLENYEIQELEHLLSRGDVESYAKLGRRCAEVTKEKLADLAAELKQLREFVGAMNRVAIEEWHGHYQDGEFWFFESDGEGVASGTDPFDAWQKMRAEGG